MQKKIEACWQFAGVTVSREVESFLCEIKKRKLIFAYQLIDYRNF